MRDYLDRDLKTRITTRDRYELLSNKGVVHNQTVCEYSNTTLIETTTESGFGIADPITDAVAVLTETIANVNVTSAAPNFLSLNCDKSGSPKIITLKEDIVIQRVSFMSFVDYDQYSKLILMLDIGSMDQQMISELQIGKLGTSSVVINEDTLINYTSTDKTLTAVISGNTTETANGLLTISYYKTSVD